MPGERSGSEHNQGGGPGVYVAMTMAVLAPGGQALGYAFRSPRLLRQALTHRSIGRSNNERLEFLGDSVLGVVITEVLFHQFPHLLEGDLTRMRAQLVKGPTLAQLARQYGLAERIVLGRGELKTGGFKRDSILADTFEAVLGAIYLDSDLATVRAVILRTFATLLQQIPPHAIKDPKTRLQEWLQHNNFALPEYHIHSQSGPAHRPVFEVVCRLPHLDICFAATGSSRRQAEQGAAANALIAIPITPITEPDASGA